MYEKFIALLNERGGSCYQISKITGIPNSTFTDWKKGKSKPKLEKLKRIADYFEVPISYFLE